MPPSRALIALLVACSGPSPPAVEPLMPPPSRPRPAARSIGAILRGGTERHAMLIGAGPFWLRREEVVNDEPEVRPIQVQLTEVGVVEREGDRARILIENRVRTRVLVWVPRAWLATTLTREFTLAEGLTARPGVRVLADEHLRALVTDGEKIVDVEAPPQDALDDSWLVSTAGDGERLDLRDYHGHHDKVWRRAIATVGYGAKDHPRRVPAGACLFDPRDGQLAGMTTKELTGEMVEAGSWMIVADVLGTAIELVAEADGERWVLCSDEP